MKKRGLELRPQDLKPFCDPDQFKFKTTAELGPWDEIIGQKRAVDALKFGLRIKRKGYNIYASGIPGTGKITLIRSMVQEIAVKEPVPDDWCYVYNFKNPGNPKTINLKAGKGRELSKDMEEITSYLRDTLPNVFEGKDYTDEKNRILDETNRSKETLFEDLILKGKEMGFQIKSERSGISIIPLSNGRPMERKDIERLGPGERRIMEEREKNIQQEIRDVVAKSRFLDKEAEEKLQLLNKQVVNFSIEDKFKELKERYSEYPQVIEYLNEVYEDILRNFREFLPIESPQFALPFIEELSKERTSIRYRVNLVIDNGDSTGAPVVEDTHPTYTNLIGRIEKKAHLGTLQTDFSMIRSGSILQANGGYLILNITDVLKSPFSWDALKRVIKQKEVKIEDVGELYGVVTGSTLKPEPIPVDLKVVLIGPQWIYHLLQIFEDAFSKIFKVKADFDYCVDNTSEGILQYANFIGKVCREDNCLPFDKEAVASVVEYSSRLVDHQKKLSLRFSEIADLIQESSFWASERGEKAVRREDIEKAIEEKIFRSNLLEEHIQEAIYEGTLLVDVEGSKEGQVNGLSVYSIGDYAFGRPTRITARTFLGKKGVVNIEREAKLSGKTHSKGVLILGGYLGGHYAQNQSLSLSASIGFEQTYSEIDGDSASAAELIAILSSLAGVAVKQNMAITGSINQYGEIQPIGSVNEKIEGFFAVCESKGLTGKQGVIIPHQNTKHLAIKKKVINAVEEGKFHIYAVKDIDEAIELLTDIPAGKRESAGRFPEGTVNFLVEERLKVMATRLKKDNEEGKGK